MSTPRVASTPAGATVQVFLGDIDHLQDLLLAFGEGATNVLEQAGGGPYWVAKAKKKAKLILSHQGPGIDVLPACDRLDDGRSQCGIESAPTGPVGAPWPMLEYDECLAIEGSRAGPFVVGAEEDRGGQCVSERSEAEHAATRGIHEQAHHG